MLWSILLLLNSVIKNDRILAVLFVTGFGMLRASLIQFDPMDPSCTNSMKGLPACNFDKSWCGIYTNQSMDKGGLVWKRGNTIAAEAGGKSIKRDWQPGVKGKQGSFVYLDVQNLEVPKGSKSRLNGKILSKDTKAVCIEFHYATTSTDASKLPTISIINHMEEELEQVIGKVKVDTQGQWRTARFHSCVGKSSTIAFESEKLSHDSLVGLDYIKVMKSSMDCSRFPSYCTDSMSGLPSCNFDNNLCGIYSVKSLDNSGLKWSRITSKITHDWHPKGEAGRVGHFVNLDVHEESVPIGAKARLTGEIINPKIRAVCVEFHYYISSHDTDHSPVVTVINEWKDGSEHLVGKISGDTKGKWKKAQLHFCVGTLSMISFESEKISVTSVVGLDYIKVTRSDMGCGIPTITIPTTAQTTETFETRPTSKSTTTLSATPTTATTSSAMNPTTSAAAATQSKTRTPKASTFTTTSITTPSRSTSSKTAHSSMSTTNMSTKMSSQTSTAKYTAPTSTKIPTASKTMSRSTSAKTASTSMPTTNMSTKMSSQTSTATHTVPTSTKIPTVSKTMSTTAIPKSSTSPAAFTLTLTSPTSTTLTAPTSTMALTNFTSLTTATTLLPTIPLESTNTKTPTETFTTLSTTSSTATIPSSTKKPMASIPIITFSMTSTTRLKPITITSTRNTEGNISANITKSTNLIDKITTVRSAENKSDTNDGASTTTIIAGCAAGIALCFLVVVVIVFGLMRRKRKLNNAFSNLYATDDDNYDDDGDYNNAVGVDTYAGVVRNDQNNVIQLRPVPEDSTADFHC